MFVKVMGQGSEYRLYDGVSEVKFARFTHAAPVAMLTFDDGTERELQLDGDAYVLNESGKTIDRFRVAEAA